MESYCVIENSTFDRNRRVVGTGSFEYATITADEYNKMSGNHSMPCFFSVATKEVGEMIRREELNHNVD